MKNMYVQNIYILSRVFDQLQSRSLVFLTRTYLYKKLRLK